MENKTFKAHEVPEDTEELPPREPPPSYSSIYPHGLDQLSTLSQVEVRQKNVITEHGNVIFNLNRQLDKGDSTIFLDLRDTTGRVAIRIEAVDAFWNPRLEVHIDGQYVAKLGLNSFLNSSPNFVVCDANGDKVLKIKYTPGLHPNKNQYWLRLDDLQGVQLGTITNKWISVENEKFADSKELYIDFPRDLGVQYKATVIGLCIVLINQPTGFWPSMLTWLR